MHIQVEIYTIQMHIYAAYLCTILHCVIHKYALFDAYFSKMSESRTHMFETFVCSIRVFVKHKYVSLLRRLKVTAALASGHVLGTSYFRMTPYLEPSTNYQGKKRHIPSYFFPPNSILLVKGTFNICEVELLR